MALLGHGSFYNLSLGGLFFFSTQDFEWSYISSAFYIFYLETGSPYVSQAALAIVILLPQAPECWADRFQVPRPGPV